jgi:hypothetical protein
MKTTPHEPARSDTPIQGLRRGSGEDMQETTKFIISALGNDAIARNYVTHALGLTATSTLVGWEKGEVPSPIMQERLKLLNEVIDQFGWGVNADFVKNFLRSSQHALGGATVSKFIATSSSYERDKVRMIHSVRNYADASLSD